MENKMLDTLKKALGLNKRGREIFNDSDEYLKKSPEILEAGEVLKRYSNHVYKELDRNLKLIKASKNNIANRVNDFVVQQKSKFSDKSFLFNSPYLKLQYNALNKLKENKRDTSSVSWTSYGNYIMQRDFVQNDILKKLIPQSSKNKYFNFLHQKMGGKYLRNIEKTIENLSDKILKDPMALKKIVFKKKKIRDTLIKVGKKPLKSFTGLTGYYLNIDTILNDPSYFKKTFSLIDVIGDSTGILAPVTSSANLIGSSIYDFCLKDSQKKVADDISKEYLKSNLPTDIFNIDTILNDPSHFKKFLAKNDILGDSLGRFSLPSSFTSSINFTGSLMYDYLLSDSMKNKLDTIFKEKNSKQSSKNRRILQIAKPKTLGNNVIDLYKHNNTRARKNYLPIQHNGEVVQTKLQGSQIDNLGKNNFTININGTNKSTQEIMNEIVPEIKLRMKNISVA